MSAAMHPPIAAKAQSPKSSRARSSSKPASRTTVASPIKPAPGVRPSAPMSTPKTAPRKETKPNISAAPGRQSAPGFSAPTAPPPGPARFYTSTKPEPAYFRDDPGLACLNSQLGRIREQMRYLDYVRTSVARAEEECRRDLAASLARSLVSSSGSAGRGGKAAGSSQPNSTAAPHASDLDQWSKHWDAEVGAEYFYNDVTGEASWLDPRYGM